MQKNKRNLNHSTAKRKKKKEQLTEIQKRKIISRTDNKGNCEEVETGLRWSNIRIKQEEELMSGLRTAIWSLTMTLIQIIFYQLLTCVLVCYSEWEEGSCPSAKNNLVIQLLHVTMKISVCCAETMLCEIYIFHVPKTFGLLNYFYKHDIIIITRDKIWNLQKKILIKMQKKIISYQCLSYSFLEQSC